MAWSNLSTPGGYGCWGWVALDPVAGEVARDCGSLGQRPDMTNNYAEYVAAGKALRWAAEQGQRGVLLRTDSQLVVNQTNGEWQCNKEHLRRLRDRLRELVRATDARLEWVPRTMNERADELSRQAYRDARGAIHG